MFDNSIMEYDMGKVTTNATKGELKDLQISKGGSVALTDSRITATFTAKFALDPQTPNRLNVKEDRIVLDVDFIDTEGSNKVYHGTRSFSSDDIGFGAGGLVKEGKLIQEQKIKNAQLLLYLK
jgi:hypothetical protein